MIDLLFPAADPKGWAAGFVEGKVSQGVLLGLGKRVQPSKDPVSALSCGTACGNNNDAHLFSGEF